MCPAAGECGPCPHSSCLPGRVASQTDRAYESQAFKESSAPAGSCSKASLWQEGPSRAAAPAAGTHRAQPLCQRAAPTLTWGQRDRGSCLQDRPGTSLGRGCSGTTDGLGWVSSLLPGPGSPLLAHRSNHGGGRPLARVRLGAGASAGNTVTTRHAVTWGTLQVVDSSLPHFTDDETKALGRVRTSSHVTSF